MNEKMLKELEDWKCNPIIYVELPNGKRKRVSWSKFRIAANRILNKILFLYDITIYEINKCRPTTGAADKG